MSYNIDLSTLSIDEYKELLIKQKLLPGRKMLHQNIDYNFTLIKNQGITNIAQLMKLLSTKTKLTSFMNTTGICEEYLVLLKREIGSLEQKPVEISKFPGVDSETVAILATKGINNSKDYYEKMLPSEDELYCFCNLVRINGVGPAAAKAFYEAGYQKITQIATANANDMLIKVTKVNQLHEYYKANLGEKDMQF